MKTGCHRRLGESEQARILLNLFNPLVLLKLTIIEDTKMLPQQCRQCAFIINNV